eukprot:Em0004g107a
MSWDRKLFDEDPNVRANELLPGAPSNATVEDKERQFMGASMDSTGDMFVVCAPLWVNTYRHTQSDPDYRPQGRCYYSPRNLTGFHVIQPCNGGIVTSNDGDSQCTAGIAVTTLNDTFILGAPGQSSGSGALYYTPQLPQYSSPPFGGETILTYTESSFFSIGPTIPLSTYQGFTLATGNILDKVKKNLVTSYRQFVGSSYHELLKFYNASDPYVSIMTLPMGESPTENFGYSLVAADLNGDGWDEIIAGAPMYSTSSMLEIGRIYVFSNYDGTFMSNATVVVTGTISLGRFGHAIVNLGDINGDNCDDLAVSAPYASQNGTSSSSGVVYIFLGSNANLLNTVPFQTLDAADVMRANQLPELKSFGFSLASGVDVDGNLYNDLVIGALFSQTVVLYRTLSIALINVTLNAPDDVSIVMQNCSGYACFVVGICASYSGRGLAGPLGLNMEVREVVSGVQPKRLFFGAPVGKMNAYVSQFQFLSSGGVYCLSVVSYIENSSAGTTSLPFEVQVLFSPNSRNVTSSGPRPLLDLRQYPEINVTGNNTVQVAIRKNCNTATMCLPDLDLSLNQIVYSSGSGSTPSLVADVTKYINMSVKCASVKDDAFGSTLTATFPSYLELTSQNGLPSCATCWICLFPGNSTTSCTFEPFLLRANDSIQVELRWSVKSVTLLGNEKFNISVNVLVPNDIRTNNNEVTVPIAATAMAELSLELAVDQTSLQYSRAANYSATDTYSLNDFGTRPSKLTMSFLNKGPSTIQNLLLDIYYPYQSEDTGKLFYLYAGPASNETFNTGIHVSCKGDNPRGIPSVPARTRRSTERYTSLAQWWLDQASGLLPKRRSVPPLAVVSGTVDCSDLTQRSHYCGHVNCTIKYLLVPADRTSKNLFINLPLYVDDRYFASKKGNYSLVIGAQVTILNSYIQDTASVSGKTFLTSLTLSPGPVVETTTPNAPIPWYLYVIPAIVGLVFIIIIGCILYFCGFLRRKRLIPPEADQPQSPRGVPQSAPGTAGQPTPSTPGQPTAQPSQPEGPKTGEASSPEDDLPEKIDDDAYESEI